MARPRHPEDISRPRHPEDIARSHPGDLTRSHGEDIAASSPTEGSLPSNMKLTPVFNTDQEAMEKPSGEEAVSLYIIDDDMSADMYPGEVSKLQLQF